uniref:XK-related protein n=1 Tax=Strigamia maritima TaxID=126957 RepID=T1IQS8_STRMM
MALETEFRSCLLIIPSIDTNDPIRKTKDGWSIFNQFKKFILLATRFFYVNMPRSSKASKVSKTFSTVFVRPVEKLAELEDLEVDNIISFRKEYTYLNFVFDSVGFALFYVDYVSDIILIVTYFNKMFYVYAGLTTTFVVVPSVLISIFSMIWYRSADAIEVSPVSSKMWTLRIIFHLLLMAPAWRAIESMHFGWKNLVCSNSQYEVYRIKFVGTRSLLKAFESFLEAAPQLVLQIYILITGNHMNKRITTAIRSEVFSVKNLEELDEFSKMTRVTKSNVMGDSSMRLETTYVKMKEIDEKRGSQDEKEEISLLDDGKDEKIPKISKNEELKSLDDDDDDDLLSTLSEKSLKFTHWDYVLGVVAICFFYFDLGADIVLMKSYFNDGLFIYFGLTMMFVVVPSVLISIFSTIWYCSDDAIEPISTVPPIMWKLRIIFHLLLMAPAWR